jgi:hypothetical protein
MLLATILLSTSSLSGCRSPAVSRDAKEKVEYVNEVSERVFRRCGGLQDLQEERARANSPIKQASRTICVHEILEENPVILNAVIDELQKTNHNDSLTELEKVAFEAATKEAQKLDINLSKAQLQIIAQEATYAFLDLEFRQPQASSPSLLEQSWLSFQKYILRQETSNSPVPHRPVPVRAPVGH